jgi:hypothetical protein
MRRCAVVGCRRRLIIDNLIQVRGLRLGVFGSTVGVAVRLLSIWEKGFCGGTATA